VEEQEAEVQRKKPKLNNPTHRLKTGRRRKRGRPAGKLNYICCDCGKAFHAPPSHIGRYKRCHRCRKGMGGRRHNYREIHLCPLCGGWKHQRSHVCLKCWNEGRRYDRRNRQEKQTAKLLRADRRRMEADKRQMDERSLLEASLEDYLALDYLIYSYQVNPLSFSLPHGEEA